MIYYAIRHIKTKALMPEVKGRRGYSHWNPDNNSMPVNIFLGIPRLLMTRKQAERCINMWFHYPNGRIRTYQFAMTNEWDEDISFKPDNRKKEDLEIIKIELRVRQ